MKSDATRCRKSVLFRGIIVLSVAIVIFVYFICIREGQQLYYQCSALSRVYGQFLRDHDGRCPNNIEELIEGGYLRRVADKYGIAYVVPKESDDDIVRAFAGILIRDMDEFDIKYGGSIESVQMVNGEVTERINGAQFLFVRPQRKDLISAAQDFTARIYCALDSGVLDANGVRTEGKDDD